MGWSFRKSVNLGNGVRVNLGKRSPSLSGGVRGARYSSRSGWRFTFRHRDQLPAEEKAAVMQPAVGGATTPGRPIRSPSVTVDWHVLRNGCGSPTRGPECRAVLIAVLEHRKRVFLPGGVSTAQT